MAKPKKEPEVRKIENIIAVQPREDGLSMILTSYFETDALNAAGQILRDDWSRTGDFETTLNTNDTLAALWAAPNGSLWVGSALGNVWTTAPVTWPAAKTDGLDFDPGTSKLDWKVTTLPDLEKRRMRPNVTAIWGTSDSDVHAATFQGAVYQWDGRAWKERPTGVTTGINDMHGTAKDDIWCVGDGGAILHFDGRAWRTVPYPGDAGSGDALTGVRAVSRTEAFICGRSGRVLHGSASGLEILLEAKVKFYGIAWFQKRLILAAGMDGVHEVKRNKATKLRDTFAAVGVFEAGRLLTFVEPAQDDGPCIVEYNPADKDDPWWRRQY